MAYLMLAALRFVAKITKISGACVGKNSTLWQGLYFCLKCSFSEWQHCSMRVTYWWCHNKTNKENDGSILTCKYFVAAAFVKIETLLCKWYSENLLLICTSYNAWIWFSQMWSLYIRNTCMSKCCYHFLFLFYYDIINM